jgi:signal transduction histidine kinase
MSDAIRHALQVPETLSRRAEEAGLKQILLDLHDGPMQLLYAALLQLELLQASLGGDGEPVHRASQVQMLLERASVELRHIIDQRQARAAESSDLLTLLRELAAEHQVATRTSVRVLAREHLPDPGPEGRQAFYRVLQESLSNAYRHGRAEKVAVRLGLIEQEGSKQLWMTVEDDGSGFDPADVSTDRETGIPGMSERMRSAGGELTVKSAPGTGTTIHAALEVD